jgi:hypothetical protein
MSNIFNIFTAVFLPADELYMNTLAPKRNSQIADSFTGHARTVVHRTERAAGQLSDVWNLMAVPRFV